MIRPITTAQVVLLYEHGVGAGVLRDPGSLDGAVQASFQEVFDRVMYPTLAQKAGKLLEGIQRVQAFSDGNKRLAWIATTSFLQMNGQVVVDVAPAEVDSFVRSLVGDPEAEFTAAVWLNERLRGTL